MCVSENSLFSLAIGLRPFRRTQRSPTAQRPNGPTATNCHLSGVWWDLESDAQSACLYPPDGNWGPSPQNVQTFVIKWNY